MLVRVKPLRCGAYIAYPVNQRYREKYRSHMKKMTGRAISEAFFQSDCDLPEEIALHRNYRDLTHGWSLTIQIDPWLFGHWLGYDACTVEL